MRSIKPVEFGDARDVVAILHLSRQGLEALMYAFSPLDLFSKECRDVLMEVDKRVEDREKWLEDQPGLAIVIVRKGEV